MAAVRKPYFELAIVAMVMVTLLAGGSETAAVQTKCDGKADVLYILDTSSSVGSQNFELLLQFAANVSSAFVVGSDKVLFSVMTFSSGHNFVFGFQDNQNNEDLRQAILSINYFGGLTYTGRALREARTFCFTQANGARPSVATIAIVITDGRSTDPSDTIAEALMMRDSGRTVIALGIGDGVDTNELENIATTPSLVFSVNNFKVLEAIRDKLSTSVCEEQKKQENKPDPIFTCVGRKNGNYRASSPLCAEGYYYSCSSGRAYTMPCGLGWYTATNGTRFTARKVYKENDDRCELEVEYCPRDPENYPVPPPPSSDSNSGHTERPCIDSRNSCVGKPNMNYPQCYPNCQNGYYYSCSNNESHLMPCALGWYTDKNNVRYTDKMVYDSNTDSCQLTCSSCPRATRTVESTPDSLVHRDNDTDTPQCQGKADIVLILDSSGSIGMPNYEIMKIFIASVVSRFTVGPQDVQFAAIIFSYEVISLFNFTHYNSERDVRAAIMNASYLDMTTNTAGALSLAKDLFSSPSAGARSGVGKVAVVVTDGISDYRQDTEIQADRLKSSGVKVVAVGVGPGADREELLAIASSENDVMEVEDFNILNTIRRVLVTSACDNVKIDKSKFCIASNKDCVGKPNSNYPACNPECQRGIYYTCSNNAAFQRTCANNWYTNKDGSRYFDKMVFDSSKDSCEYVVETCPRDLTNMSRETPPLDQSRQSTSTPASSEEASSSCVTETCQGFADGVYSACGQTCRNGYYYVCNNQEETRMSCPPTSYRDASNNLYEANGVYDPSSETCQESSDFCPRNHEDYKI